MHECARMDRNLAYMQHNCTQLPVTLRGWTEQIHCTNKDTGNKHVPASTLIAGTYAGMRVHTKRQPLVCTLSLALDRAGCRWSTSGLLGPLRTHSTLRRCFPRFPDVLLPMLETKRIGQKTRVIHTHSFSPPSPLSPFRMKPRTEGRRREKKRGGRKKGMMFMASDSRPPCSNLGHIHSDAQTPRRQTDTDARHAREVGSDTP